MWIGHRDHTPGPFRARTHRKISGTRTSAPNSPCSLLRHPRAPCEKPRQSCPQETRRRGASENKRLKQESPSLCCSVGQNVRAQPRDLFSLRTAAAHSIRCVLWRDDRIPTSKIKKLAEALAKADPPTFPNSNQPARRRNSILTMAIADCFEIR